MEVDKGKITVKDIWWDSDIFNPKYSISISCDRSMRLHVIVFLTYTSKPPPLPLFLSLLNMLYPGISKTASGERLLGHVSERPRKSKLEWDSKCSSWLLLETMLRIFKCPPSNPLVLDRGSQISFAWLRVWLGLFSGEGGAVKVWNSLLPGVHR